jgi:pilin isopeptide linkage protein
MKDTRSEAPAMAQIQMTKTIHSNSSTVTGGEFTFNMYSNGRLIATTKNDAEGNIIFPPVAIDNVSEMDYEVFEVPDYPPKPGWIYDSHQCTAHVSVTRDPVTGALTAKVTYNPAVSPNFVNTYYNPEAPVTVQNKVIGHGKTISNGQFVFDIVDGNGNVVGQTRNDSEGNIIFPEIDLPGGDYNYKIIPPADGNGWTFDKKEIPVHIHVGDNGDGSLTPTVTYPSDPNFNATYRSKPASTGNLGAPHAAKIVSGGNLYSGQFTFGLYDKDGKLVATTTNASDGVAFFPAMSFDKVGIYDYTIKELTPDGNGWTTDKGEYPYRVTVTDDGMGQLHAADTYPKGSPRYHNTYTPAPALTSPEQTPKGTKTVTGGSLADSQFNFGIYDSKGNLIETAANDANGKITFPSLPFRMPGVYHFTVKESTPDGGGYTTDKTVYPYTVTVTDDGNGNLTITTDPADPNFTFTNKYTTAGSESVVAYKSLKGWNYGQTVPEFGFTLKDKDGNIVKTALNKDGTIDFGEHTFDKPGDYEYTINENTPLPAGWSSDGKSYRVIIHMEDDGAGNLIASVSYPDSGTNPVFVNTYTSRPANVGNVMTNNPSGENPIKIMTGNSQPVKDSYFNLGLYDGDGNLVALGFVDPTGKVRFPVFFSSKLGNTRYTLKEINVDDRGWHTDRSEFPVNVNITDNGQGLRLAEVTYPNGTPKFVNTYKASDGEADINAKVIGHGNAVKDGQFEFDVVDSNGNVVGKAKNDSNGNIIFPTLTLPDGDYDYKILAPKDGGGWRFDVPSLPVHIHVTDNGNGTSNAVVSYPAGSVFNPSYPPAPANVGQVIGNNPSGEIPTKRSAGFNMSADEFMFGLYDKNNRLVAVGFNSADGKIRFPLFYSAALGESDYSLKELTIDGNDWTTDKKSFPVKVNITDPGTGRLQAAVTYPNGTPEFVNTRRTLDGVFGIIRAKKTLTGAELAANGFTFGLFDDAGNLVNTATNDGDGNITFPPLIYDEPGKYHYTVKELAKSEGDWIIDETVHDVTVNVTENEDYKLTADVVYDVNPITFNNVYTKVYKPVVVEFEVCCCCKTMTFKTPGVYRYVLDGVIVDINVYEDGTGQLKADVKYNINNL